MLFAGDPVLCQTHVRPRQEDGGGGQEQGCRQRLLLKKGLEPQLSHLQLSWKWLFSIATSQVQAFLTPLMPRQGPSCKCTELSRVLTVLPACLLLGSLEGLLCAWPTVASPLPGVVPAWRCGQPLGDREGMLTSLLHPGEAGIPISSLLSQSQRPLRPLPWTK